MPLKENNELWEIEGKKVNAHFFVTTICPNCGSGIMPNEINHFVYSYNRKEYAFMTFQCPACEEFFIDISSATLTYNYLGTDYVLELRVLNEFSKKSHKKSFPEEIHRISPDFEKIYNDALTAKEDNLSSIVGPGFRKALEQLVTDYLVNYQGELLEDIKGKWLKQKIDMILDDDLKEKLTATAYEGNDQTHMQKLFVSLTDDDLINLIDLCIYRIAANVRWNTKYKKIILGSSKSKNGSQNKDKEVIQSQSKK